ncbi:MAG: tryptophan synthase subunit beta [Candidatus Falkowbacteria bacterium]
MNTNYQNLPDKKGFFGPYGGRQVPPELERDFQKISESFGRLKNDADFLLEYQNLLRDYVGRPSPLYLAKNLSTKLGGAKIYLKREDLNHTGSHKINHCLGEALLAKKLGKKRVLAETGAGQHGVALATAASLLRLECEIHIGAIDAVKQSENVRKMKLLGAKVVEVTEGGKSLKEAVDSAFNSYIKNYQDTFFAIGSVVGPHPYPAMVAYFQSVVGREVRQQILKQEQCLPDYLIACVGGGSNAMGLFYDFLNDNVKMIGVEPGGRSFKNGEHSATLTLGAPGYLHGMYTYLLQDKNGQPSAVHSVASGLDYPGVGPFHSFLKDEGRVDYQTISDQEAVKAYVALARLEGIIPALESSHALAYAIKLAPTLTNDKIIVVNLSGRGDKDLNYVIDNFPEIAFD